MYSALDIAKWFLSKEAMTPKKVQKLVYYAYAWYLTLSNEEKDKLQNRLFSEDIQAWVHGPVVYELYDEYKTYRFNTIPKDLNTDFEFNIDTVDVLEQVWEVYGHFNANELESITHQEDPWILTREGYGPLDACNEVITDDKIFEYYGSRIA